MRGNYLHNWMVRDVQALFIAAGFITYLEYGKNLPDDRKNYIDLLVQLGHLIMAIECETTERYVITNSQKARMLGLPLWIVTHNRIVKRRIEAKALKYLPEIQGIEILLLTQVEQQLNELKGIKFPG